MTSIIAYGSRISAKNINGHGGRSFTFYVDRKPLSIRIEIVKADAVRALDMAKPLKGETVLNSMELE